MSHVEISHGAYPIDQWRDIVRLSRYYETCGPDLERSVDILGADVGKRHAELAQPVKCREGCEAHKRDLCLVRIGGFWAKLHPLQVRPGMHKVNNHAVVERGVASTVFDRQMKP